MKKKEAVVAENVSPGPFEISRIVDRAPDYLKPWAGNPRLHSTKQITKLKASIRHFGFTNPILTDEEGVILSGHGRLEAAKLLGLESVPTRVIVGLTEAQKCAFVVADNKISDLSSFDDNLLKRQLEIIIEAQIDIELTGLSTAEVDIMFEPADESKGADPHDLQAEDIREEVVSRLGDCWLMGPHRLLCANAIEAESYSLLMLDELAQLVISDPPYNVAISGFAGGKGKVKHPEFVMASGEMSRKEFTAFLNTAFLRTRDFSVDGAIHFYCMDWRHLREIQDAAEPLFGPMRQLCVWAKDNAGMGTFYRSQHELVLVFKKGDAPHTNNFELGQHGRYRTNLWSYPGVNTFTGKGYELLAMHPTVKPVSLIADALRDCSHRQDIVLDPFAGSGTIFIAAERTGRHARGIELDPKYVDVAIMRWQRVTGKQAVLVATGQTWDQVRAERLPEIGKEASHGL
jgi:DNA modification methylase